jgi:HEAT repeat protein
MSRWFLAFAAAASIASSDLHLPTITWAPQEREIATAAPAPWLRDDPADSLYRVAREALNQGQFHRAAALFGELVRKHPKSGYAGDALYWQAFAQYREGGADNLKSALARLEMQRTSYPKATTRGDADALATRIRGALARQGDPSAAESVIVEAQSATASSDATSSGVGSSSSSSSRDECNDDDDIKLAALNAVLQMDAERAMPLLTRVLARRDAGSVCLRRKAVFLVAQKKGDDGADILVAAARNDPDPEVRSQAVFWLSQVNTPQAVAALDSIARRTTDAELQEKAVFALSQQHDPKAAQALRDIAELKSAPHNVREKAIFWLSQSRSAGIDYLKGLYDRLDDDDLREKVIFGVSQVHSPESSAWLLALAKNSKSTVELRKKAIFWLSQGGASANDLGALYQSLDQQELKEQAIFALSQSRDSAAVDRLMDIAKKDSDNEMRKKALFWLSQSHDPRVMALIEQILNN